MAELDITPQFGEELKDGFKPVNAWVALGNGWLDDVQQFYRERSAIEKEYSSKLSALAKKYYERKAKRSSTLSVGETPTVTPGSLESASMTTWTVQLTALESRAAEHDRFATELTGQLAEPLRILQGRCEDLRKQHIDFATKLEKERDSVYADLKKTKGRYDGVCQEVENRRKKIDSSYDGGKTKAQSAFAQQQADMHNAKNTYLISINVTNKQKERYYHDYLPEVIDSLQDLSESRVAKLNAIWSRAAELETGVLERSTGFVKHVSTEIPRNNPLLDSMMFVRHNASNWQEPADFAFEPAPVWLDDDSMASSDPAKVFLRNQLAKSKRQVSELRPQVDAKRKEVEQLKRTRQRVREGKEKHDEVEVVRGTFILQEQLHELEMQKVSAEVEVATIVTTVGDVSVGGRNHDFKPQTFKIPTNCDLCGERIWGLSAKGFDCRLCGFTCHSKCEMKVPADCPGEQDKDQRRRLKVERQEAAHSAKPVDNPVPERQSTAPSLSRSETVNSMSTLSSGYAASTPKTSTGSVQPRSHPDPDPEPEPEPEAAQEPVKPAPSRPTTTARPRVLAPPPTKYVTSNDPEPPKPREKKEKKARMLYPYEQRDEGELTVSEGREVVVLEPDDGSGWMKVRAGGDEGLVPAAYTEPVLASTANNSGLDRNSTYSASSVSLTGSTDKEGTVTKKKGPAVAPKRGAKKLQYVEAVYDYTARSEAEHSMVEGERFVLVNRDAGDGWSDVEKSGVTKSVPANYIQDV